MDGIRRVQVQRLNAAVTPAERPPDATGLVVAYSGGPDSTALLHALAHAGHGIPLRAVHVCHHLHPRAGEWAAHCRAFSADLGVAFACIDVHVQRQGESLEAAARHARYQALADVLQAQEVLVLAHHVDDQAETFLIQALRGSGVAGLASMPHATAFACGMLWRPLLGLERTTLSTYVHAHGLSCVHDPSNDDTALDRGYMRRTLWPRLRTHWPAASQTLARSAQWCAQANALVNEISAQDYAGVRDADGCVQVHALATLSTFRQGNVLRHWLAERGLDRPGHRHVEQIQHLLTARAHAGPRVCWANTEVRVFDGRLHAMRTLPPPPGDWQVCWDLQAPLPLPHGCGQLHAIYSGRCGGSVTVCLRRGGERFVDTRRGGTRTLKQFLQEARVPPWLRQRMPLLFYRGVLVAIADLWCAPQAGEMLGVTGLSLVWKRPGAKNVTK